MKLILALALVSPAAAWWPFGAKEHKTTSSLYDSSQKPDIKEEGCLDPDPSVKNRGPRGKFPLGSVFTFISLPEEVDGKPLKDKNGNYNEYGKKLVGAGACGSCDASKTRPNRPRHLQLPYVRGQDPQALPAWLDE